MLNDERVSVIIPARNEEANIARALRSLANQKGVREILVVDDQSEDRTADILVSLAPEIPRLRTLQVRSLPGGWLGKTHALAQGARAASGEWLLFTDADTEHLPGSLAELLERAESEHAGLLSLSPGQETPTWWEKSVIPMVYAKLAELFRFSDVTDPASPVAAANGQYVLVRREIYQRIGGHEAVRAAILDDVELARRIKAAREKLLFLPGARWVRTRMYRRFGEMWQGWTKNLYLLYGGNSRRILGVIASLWLFDVLPALAFLVLCLYAVAGHTHRGVLLAVLAVFVLALWRQWRYGQALTSLGFDPALANYQPIGAALLGALLFSSVYAHRSKGQVAWKGRQYTTKGMG